jgi:thiosulfate reductase cytochrome b subunit
MVLSLKQNKACPLILLLFITFMMFNTATFAQNQPDKYMESKGQRKVQYLVKDIHSIEKPYNYIIGQTKYFYLEILGIFTIVGAILFGVLHGLGRYIAYKNHPVKLEYVNDEFIYNIIIRLGHWVNALAVLVLIGTGFNMHYFGPSHQLGLIHNIFGLVFFICNSLFIIYELITFDFKQFVVEDWELKEGIIKQAMFYAIGIFKQEEHPYHMERKNRLNPLQKMAYFSVMFFLVPFVGITGIILLSPDLMGFLMNYLGMENMKYVFVLHLISAFAMVSYLFGHIYLATTGDTIKQHFEVMITGYHKVYKYIKT